MTKTPMRKKIEKSRRHRHRVDTLTLMKVTHPAPRRNTRFDCDWPVHQPLGSERGNLELEFPLNALWPVLGDDEEHD